jgi:hypothetical protein
MGVDIYETWKDRLVAEVYDRGIRGNGEIFADAQDLVLLNQDCDTLRGFLTGSVNQAARPDGGRLGK